MSDSVFDVINRRFISGNSTCVERAHITKSEWDELTSLQSEVERLRGRCGELESDMDVISQIAQHPPTDRAILRIAEKVGGDN